MTNKETNKNMMFTQVNTTKRMDELKDGDAMMKNLKEQTKHKLL